MSPVVDRISSLPDTLICHILSFLRTKEAVATSVLSKRWRPLCLSVTTLDFADNRYLLNQQSYFRFVQLVYNGMLCRDAAIPIKRFNLKCVSSSLRDTSILNTWVTTAIQRKAEHLSLTLSSTIHIPCWILSGKTLVVLELTALTVKHVSSMKHVSSVGFPSLKTLHLRRVNLQERRCLVEILAACPVLEDFLISSIRVINYVPSGGQFNRLSKLLRVDISDSDSACIPLPTFHNVEFLRTDVRLWTTSVELFSFDNLTYLELIFDRHYWGWLITLLHHCPNLQILVTDKGKNFNKNNESWVYPEFVPKCLSSQLRICRFQKYEGQEGEIQFAKYIMQNARVLRALKIWSTGSSDLAAKFQMTKKLLLCPRISVTCELSFE